MESPRMIQILLSKHLPEALLSLRVVSLWMVMFQMHLFSLLVVFWLMVRLMPALPRTWWLITPRCLLLRHSYGHPKFFTIVRQYVRDHNLDLLGIVEPRISVALERMQLLVLWVFLSLTVLKLQFLHFRITCLSSGSSSLLTVIYASPMASQRKALWPHLRALATTVYGPWILMGDFNTTLDSSDRRGGTGPMRASKDFQSFVFYRGLRDMGFSGPEFTWSRGNTPV
ncbi:hypothetical protein V6N13_043380 [Hibiscus sabdariffa]